MKKTVMTCLAIAALLAVASTAGAVTCTVDQRPAATLLVPYFQVSYDASGALVSTGPGARDTIVTIANASSAPMIAHVNIYDRESTLRLDFNIALTGFDVQAMRMSDILGGHLPSAADTVGFEVCQSAGGSVYPASDGFLRVSPTCGPPNCNPATGLDNTRAITAYPDPAFLPSFGLVDQLRANCDGGLDALAIGYVLIDHANYCNLSNPTEADYYINDAIGMENNLWGEIIFTSGEGLPTYALSTVNLESDPSFGTATNAWQIGGFPARTLYARYVELAFPGEVMCNNCGSGVSDTDLSLSAPWNEGIGDQREPLGLKWAARWFDLGTSITTNFRVWRSSPTGGTCAVDEPTVTLTFFDEDENTVTQGGCISPCSSTTFNFPLETQQRNISEFSHPPADAGWVDISFVNSVTGDVIDQAWLDYSFESSIALETILVPGTQLDPSSCNPLGVTGVQTVTPVIPSAPTGTGI